MFTSSTAERSPFPSRGRTKMRSNLGLTCNVGRDTSNIERYIAAPENGASIIERVLSFPLRGRGTALRWMR